MSGRHQIPDYYSILGVGRHASQEEIKRAYRNLVKKYHPDISPHPHAEEIMKIVNEAYRVLGDPAKRRLYDQRLQTMEAQTTRAAAATAHTRPSQPEAPTVFWQQQEHVKFEGKDVANMYTYVTTSFTFFVILFAIAGLIRSPASDAVWWDGFIGTYVAPYITAIALLMLASSYIGPAGVGYAFYIGSPFILLYMLVGGGIIALQMRTAGLNPSTEHVLLTTATAPFRFIHDLLVTSLSNNIEVAAVALSALNIAAFLAMAWDKKQAQARQWRIRETVLKRFALLGAGLGIMMGAIAFRHKIRKASFMSYIILSLAINLYFTYMIFGGGLLAKAAAAVAVGLLIGLALGVFLGHPPVTFTTTKHTTITEAVTTTSLKTSTTVRTFTSVTTYTTFRATTTVIITQTVYPAETPEILLTEHDIGNKRTKPFTVANTTDLQITFTVKAAGPVSELRFQIQLIQFGDIFVKWSREVRGREGSFDNHIVGVKPGNYLLQINCNCEWEVVVKKVF